MASTAAPELILRFPSSTQSQQPQRRRSENIGGDITTSAIVEPMIGVYQRTLSLTDNPTISSESDTGDQGEGEKDAAMNAAVADSSPVAAGHAVCTDDEDGDDDVFDTTPAAVTSETKNPTVPVSADGQYDDLSTFTASIQQKDELQRQSPSLGSYPNDESSKKLPMRVVVNRKNVSVPDSSHNSMEATTSTIVGATNNTLSRQHQQQQPVFIDACSLIPESPCGTPTGISLFEKLVRTHPIWYLPHIGRVAAVHLLRGKSPGVFIVRRSSQPNSMAISIKLLPGANQDIEHYLLETTIAGVHLEGSPNYFRELPFLLAYYCENGDELHTTLTLPKAILDCETLRDLCSLALLGPEFWTSKHCAVDPPAIGEGSIPDTGPKQRAPSPPTRLKDELENEPKEVVRKEKLVQSESNPEDITRVSLTSETQLGQHSSAAHRRSLSISGYPGASIKAGSTSNRALAATIREHVGGAFRKPAPFPNPAKETDTNAIPSPACGSKKQGHKDRSVLAKFRSESVSSALSTEVREQPKDRSESNCQQERRSFRLRSLFEVARRPSVGSSPSPSSQQQSRFGLTSSSKNKKPKPASLGSPTKDMATEVHAAADLTAKLGGRQQQAIFYVHRRPAPAPPTASPPVPQRSSKRTSPSQIPQPEKTKEDHEYYYFSPAALPSPSFGGALNESRSISSLLQEAAAAEERQQAAETPTMARRRLLTFKPGSPSGNEEDITPTTSSADTTLERQVTKKTTASLQTLPADPRHRTTPPAAETRQQSAPPSEKPPTLNSPQSSPSSFIRPPVLRREKSDLGWLPSANGNRSGGVFGAETSKLLQQHRQAILPPDNKDETFKTCVEELRKRRLEALRLQMVSNTNILHSRRDGSAHVISPGATRKPMLVATTNATKSPRASPTMNSTLAFTASAPSSASNSVLRTKSTRQHGLGTSNGTSHRLSAPNLAELSPSVSGSTSGSSERRAVADLLRDIRSRQQQKTPATNVGGLHTINEGLVTPLARRRHGAASKRQPDGTTERRLSQSLEDLPTATTAQEKTIPSAEAVASAPVVSARKSAPEKSSKNATTNLPVRRQESHPTSSGIHRRNEKAFHDETNFQWVAVTNEMRHRQKVAKVAPTRSPYCSHPASGSTSALGSKFSDYVMLNECAEIVSEWSGNGQGLQEDDVEYGSGRYGSIVGGDSRRHDSQVFSVPSSAGFLSTGGPQQQQMQDADIDDTRSVVSAAGTVFNEPWDSSVWENLLTLASSMDKNTNRVTTDSRSSFTVSTSSAASSNRPSRVESTSAADGPRVSSSTAPKEESEKWKKHPKLPHNRQTALAWADRLKKLKENNIPPPLAPNWEEFSSCVPMSSDSSLPTSTPTNSLESKRKSMTAAAAESSWSPHEDTSGARASGGDDISPLNEDRFHLAPVASPLRFRNGTSASNRRMDRSKRRPMNDPGYRIQDCVERLSNDITTFFGAQVQYFIKCTTEGHETDPLIVLGNVRQFMNGLKNYLVKHGECDLHPLIEQERSKLRPTEFLNIDAILEGVLQKIILAPLKPHLYHLLVKEGSSNGSLEVLSENLAVVRNRSPLEIGVTVEACDTSTMEQVRNSLRKMQYHYSPLKKLEYLLNAVSLAYEHRQSTPTVPNGRRSPSSSNQLPCADELLRWFVYLVSRCSMVGCEIESIYMWNLLHPALLAGEASYYLTAFSSAVHVLKNVDLLPKLNDACSLSSQMGEGGEGFIKVAIPDEISGAIRYHSFPIMPQLTVARLCRMIARKCGITNPEDYGLYLLVDGYETCLISSECPELVKEHLRTSNKAHLFAYKRHEAKIAWPKVAVSPRL